MSTADTRSMQMPPRIFISAVTNEFKRERQEIAQVFEKYAVHVQRDYPTELHSHIKIAEMIEKADVIICLIGFKSGGKFLPGQRPPDAVEGSSFTQWEYDHARAVVSCHREKLLLPFRKTRMASPGEPIDPDQIAFRKRIYCAEKDRPDGLFFYPCDDADEPARSLRQMIHDPSSGLTAVLNAFWLSMRSIYRRQVVDSWRTATPYSYTVRTVAADKRRLMDAGIPPFIETRAFSILNPNKGRQLPYLKPPAFVTGRDTNAELLARKDADWRPIVGADETSSAGDLIVEDLQQPHGRAISLGGVELTQPIRLFVVSGSGIGKTKTLEWLQARLSGSSGDTYDPTPDYPRLALLLLAGDLQDVAAADLIETLVEHVVRRLSLVVEPWQRDTVRVGLQRDAEEGNLVLLIDGLDHSTDLKLFMESQHRSDRWVACPIVAAGRPHALLNWQELQLTAASIDAARWRFVEPAEFDEDEANVFLGNIGTESRISLVEENLASLLFVPRILEYVRALSDDELKESRTAAAIYYRAVKRLVITAMKNPASRQLGPNWRAHVKLREPHPDQVEYMLMLLSALGFISLCPTADITSQRESDVFRTDLDPDRKGRLLARIKYATGRRINPDQLNRALSAVVAMSSLVGNGILEDLSAHGTQNVNSIMWANRTVQQFFAALWLARYADGAKAVRAILNGGPLHPLRDAAYDAQRSRHYVFFPEADIQTRTWRAPGCPNFVRTDITYEFNLFLAEMPLGAIKPSSWVAAVSAWYDPQLFSGESNRVRLWSAEMLYRSWPTMMHLAGRLLDDWWDVRYDDLARLSPGCARDTISLHDDKWTGSEEPLAGLVLDRFLGDFQRILQDGNSSQAAIAQAMIAEEQWRRMPDMAAFTMGPPDGVRQGCPTDKVDTYWKIELLDAVQTCRESPEKRGRTAKEAAEFGTWKDWFAPTAVGRNGRAFDVKWLQETLQPLAAEGAARGLRQPDSATPAYRDALRRIQSRFLTSDETPAENPHYVRSFTMHRLPVLSEWFSLFAPGHAHVVADYLRGLDVPAEPPPGNHPVTYTAWFDAWAFCQWATWQDSRTGMRYGLRLPHEPEWEFAARGTIIDGQPAQIPRDWRWWWGNDFYQDETSMVEEPVSTPRAHAIGAPGKTRAPEGAAPNGPGFHDILGNVWEWTATLYDPRRERDTMEADNFTLRYSRHDPSKRPPVNGQRTMRGGLWYYLNILATCTNRFRYVCNDRDFKMGFRVVREPRPTK